MKPEDLQKAPKLFCENITLAFSPEFFVLGVTSGAQATVYALTPELMKRFSQHLTHEVSRYEKVHGEIRAEWNPNVVSPVQKLNTPDDMS